MGTNKRYPNITPQRAEERELREASKQGQLHTLSDEQLRLYSQVVSIAPTRRALWGLAWLRFGSVDVRCSVKILRWTADAVGVEVDVDGTPQRCWIWQGACQRLESREDAWN